MGRICAWCGSILKAASVSNAPISHAICPGCRAELEDALHQVGLHLRERPSSHAGHAH